AVLERPRLRLVRVAAEELLHLAPRQERRLLAHREPGAAAPAEARVLERGQELVGLDVLQRAFECPVSAEAPVRLDRGEPGLVDVAEEHPRLTSHRSPPLLRARGRPGWFRPFSRADPARARGRR